MKKILIDTDKEPLLLKVTIRSEKPCILKFTGYDLRMEDNVYFNRGYATPEKPFSGTKSFCFPMPLSPNRLVFEASCPKMENDVDILKVEKLPLNTGDIWLRPDDKEFYEFAKKFVIKVAYLTEGAYECKSEVEDGRSFIVLLKNQLLNSDGTSATTPARISRSTGIIEINLSKFIAYSIPMRLIIMMHEYVHWRNNTRIELECDKNAINLLLKSGFAKTEVMYAFTKIFVGKDHLAPRVKEIYDFIERFKDYNIC